MVYFRGHGSNDSLIFKAFSGVISVDLVYVTAAATTGACWCFLQEQSGQAGRPGACVLRRTAGFLGHLLWTDSLCQRCSLQCLVGEQSSQAHGDDELSQARRDIASVPVLLSSQALSVERGVSGLPLDRQN